MQHRRALYAISWLATASAGIGATLFSVYLPSIVRDVFNATDQATIGRIGSFAGAAFLAGWSVGGIVLGLVGDRIGRKMTLFWSVVVAALGVFLTSLAASLPFLVVSRVITGIGGGSILMITAVMVSEAWAEGNRARMVGILINAFPVGFIAAGIIHNAVPDFRTAYLIGSSTILLAVGVLLMVRESALFEKSTALHAEHHAQRESIFDALYRTDLLVGLVLFGSMLVGLWAAYTWMPTWVSSMSEGSQQQANRARTVIMLGLGAVVGGTISGAVSNALGRRRAAALGYVAVVLISVVLFLFIRTVTPVLFACTFALSLCIGFNQGVLSAYIPELFPTLMRSTATGICFNGGRIITTITVFFVGVLVSALGGYNNAMAVFAGAYVIGLITLLYARETKGADLPT
jgi:MFS family permease